MIKQPRPASGAADVTHAVSGGCNFHDVMERTRRSCAGILALCVGSAMAAGPAAAQQEQSIPACDERPSTLTWQVRKDRAKRSVNLRFRKNAGAPSKPVQVRIVRPRVTRAFEWRALNREHYSYRRRGREAVKLTARYVENRSNYQALGNPNVLPDIPGIPLVPSIITLPGADGLPPLPLPILTLLTGPSGGAGGEFKPDYCVRTLTRTAR